MVNPFTHAAHSAATARYAINSMGMRIGLTRRWFNSGNR